MVATIEAFRAVGSELRELAQLSSDAGTDREMRDLVDAERRTLEARLPELERQVRLLLLPKDAADDKNAILEIRAGTGGDEAALFAGDLLRMYQRHADLRAGAARYFRSATAISAVSRRSWPRSPGRGCSPG